MFVYYYSLVHLLFIIYLGTEYVSSVMDPELMITQIIMSLFWFGMFCGFFWDVYFLEKDKNLSNIKRYRLNVAILGSILSILLLIYWIFHQGLFCFVFFFSFFKSL